MGGWLGLSGLSTANAAGSARIALIVDDIGRSRSIAHRFLDIPASLTYAVLPHLPFSSPLAHEINDRGFELLLHQPMEPFDAQLNPGPGALYVGDSRHRIEEVVDVNLNAVPHVIGVNNHMGSRFTSSDTEILTALRTIKRKGLFFVDSLTSHRSCAYMTARRINMNAGRRDAFLDTSRHPSAILNRLYQLANHALCSGTAIGIGHPYPETAAAIDQFRAEIQGTGVEIVSITAALNPAGDMPLPSFQSQTAAL